MNASALTDFLDGPDPQTLIVTAGRRLARHLAQTQAARRRAAGARAWEQPQILPWGAWLASLWQEYQERGEAQVHLLGEHAERALWTCLIEEDERSSSLLAPEAAARTAQEAWRLVHAWRLPSLEEIARAEANEDVRAFCRWAERYREVCETLGVIDGARLADALGEAMARRAIRPAVERVWLAGFEEFEPQQHDFLERLRATGVEVEVLPPPGVGGKVRAVRLEFKNEQEETAALARWVRHRLEADPAAHIGIVVPELGRRRTALVRALEDALVPARVLPGEIERGRPFNVSLGLPLAEYPLVAAALEIIALSLAAAPPRARLELGAVSALLRSPFVAGSETEAASRARCDAALRAAREPWVSPERLLGEAQRHGCREFARRLREWCEAIGRWPAQQTPHRWLADFAAALRAFGWPAGDRPLASEEYQTYEAWRDLIGSLGGALDRVLGDVPGEVVRRQIAAAAASELFQPQSPEVPVQVLGLFEAEGMAFDHLWITDLHDEAWPRASEPNPLLPVGLQRDYKMPRASPERELEIAERLTARWLAAAREVVVSYGVSEADRVRHASPLVAQVRLADDPEAVLGPAFMPYRRAIFETRRVERDLELCDDWQGPALGDTGEAIGGTQLITDQSACPFRAFARHRLASRALPTAAYSLTPEERGIAVHEALRVVWRTLGDKAALDRLEDSARVKLAARAAQEALARLRRTRPFTLGGRFAALERERLENLLADWLAFERNRPEGFEVLEHEARRRLEVGGLRLSARLDRVDRLEGGGLLLLDYKTGRCHPRDWFGERPRAPQLPLYALYALDANEVAGLAYARIKRGRFELVGLVRAGAAFDKLEVFSESRWGGEYGSWSALLEAWRTALSRLAEEFRQGCARPEPRERQDCQECDQSPLCRLYELDARRGLFAPGEDGEAAAGEKEDAGDE